MEKLTGFQAGVNLGGWLSQYRIYDHQHFKSFISSSDIEQIAGWGMDHVRLPIDYPILEDDQQPYAYKESGFAYIDQCLNWCQANGLNVVLDLHSAPGYSFDAPGTNSLFDSLELQQRLLALWQALAAHYAGRKQPAIIFELLNEITLPSSAPWNKLAHQLFSSIRAIDTTHWIMVGGNEWNSISALKEIALFDDPRVVYTFHYYDPLPFTHQKAPWVEELQAFDQELVYPGNIPGLSEFLDKKPSYQKRLERFRGIQMDKQFLQKDIQQALDFLHQSGRPLYCGEFGVIESAPRDSRLNWHRDFVALLREYQIGHACWSYKQMDFGLVDQAGHVVDEQLVKIVSAR